MIGDWPDRDIKGASRVGMKTCFAKYGNPEAKAKADYTITEIRQILDYLLRSIGIRYETAETAHSSFIHGRVARINANSPTLIRDSETSVAVFV